MTFQVEFATQPKVLNVEFDTALNISGGYDDGYNDGFTTGKSEGLTEGEEIGYGKGEAVGYENGYTEGDAKGYERGYTEGEDKGYASGYSEGDTVGYNRGFTEGETEGYTNGYNKGVEDTTPSGEIELTQNGTHDVAKFATAKVNVGGFTMQDFVDSRGFKNLYYQVTIKEGDLDWLATIDFSRVQSISHMFNNAYGAVASLPEIDTSNVTNFSYVFAGVSTVPWLNTSSATDTSYMFYESRYMKSVPLYDFGKVKEAHYMFCYCTSLTEIPHFDFRSLVSANQLFDDCQNIVTVPPFNFENLKTWHQMFSYCYKLETVPSFNIPKVTTISGVFAQCKVLHTVGELDIRNVTSCSMFTGCKKLEHITVKNIKTSLQVGSGTSYGHLLTLESLIGLCYELRDTGSSLTLTIGSANLAKLANVYVREIPITDAMREADDLIDEKLPFEVCDSTADGATLITDYVLLKNWKLA